MEEINLLSNPIAIVGCVILGFGILFTFVSRQFILVRLFLGDISFIKQRILGLFLGGVGALLLYWSTGHLG
ncbi:hypothetical protein GYN12_03625 [Lactococcus piscium]|jgi:hypothetical protein|uniref:hypothetical protein n=1 Tax=Pseudolactococcus carnosus TaxID=2749961 RepID=UPI0009A76329|nr:hypothetical protein [Lactococcus carnosus]MCJ1975059.1 hypothetical protein [Lactococcus carnosus]MCJ1985473.1 hypothetical protein [Lactococcus carnosus]